MFRTKGFLVLNIFITGATSYLGTYVICHLFQNDVLFCLQHAEHPDSPLRELTNIFWVPDQVDAISQLFSSHTIDWVINFAAVYERKGTAAAKIIEANCVLGSRLVGLCVDHSTPYMMTIGTALPPFFNLYSATKSQVANLGKLCADQYGLCFYNIELELFYGPNQPVTNFLPRCIEKMKRNCSLELTSGAQKRDFIHIDDVCLALSLILHSHESGYHNIHVGTGNPVPVKDVLLFIKDQLGSQSKLHFGASPLRPNEPESSTDISYLEKLGYKPHFSWQEGIRNIL